LSRRLPDLLLADARSEGIERSNISKELFLSGRCLVPGDLVLLAALKMRPTQSADLRQPQGWNVPMLAISSIALDLPLKSLVWKDSGWKGVAIRQRFGLFE
jgi:hypothetical protein